MTSDPFPFNRVFLAGVVLLIGLLFGAVGMHVWTQHYRYSYLEQEAEVLSVPSGQYRRSRSCRDCHERFYELWSTSHHGKAMQPVTPELAAKELQPLREPVVINSNTYTVDLEKRIVIEQGAAGRREYAMLHAMGGKNIFFFLTPLERGRLQVLPVAYDVNRQEWYDTAGSMVRHFVEGQDAPVDWRDPLLTFNTACYDCHVSQLDKNYDAVTDTYHTTWREPGINCEACHGPCAEHNRVCRAVPRGTVPGNLRTLRWSELSSEQVNDACAVCHAKARVIAAPFCPGNRFFDFYDLVCLEHADFYADGRDLGENYTHTTWLMSPCVQAGMLNCTHCHTSSGRFRFKDRPNASCLPCHAQRVLKPGRHTHHATGNRESPTCVSCHMPMTEFSRMKRSDHSMRPPCPAAGAQYKSPVACLLCHTDREPDWAAGLVRAWHPEPVWQPRILRQAALVAAARKRAWTELPHILAYLEQDGADPVVATSLIRLLAACPDAAQWPVLRRLTHHTAPLIRAAACYALMPDAQSPDSLAQLTHALDDKTRLVRLQAAAALAQVARSSLGLEQSNRLKAVEKELLTSFTVLPDRWSSHYNLGNYRQSRGQTDAALEAYKKAMVLRPDAIPPYVNASILVSQQGRLDDAINYLQTALRYEPEHGAVNFNLGLAMAETNAIARARDHLLIALKDEDVRAQAAYNLAAMAGLNQLERAIEYARLAAETAPDQPRFAYSLGFYLSSGNRFKEAVAVLQDLIRKHREHADAWILLGECYLKDGQQANARDHYRAMANEQALPVKTRSLANNQLQKIAK